MSTNRTWASLLRDESPRVKLVPKRLEREIFVTRRAIGSEATAAITPIAATARVNNEVRKWEKGEVKATRVLPSGDIILVAWRSPVGRLEVRGTKLAGGCLEVVRLSGGRPEIDWKSGAGGLEVV